MAPEESAPHYGPGGRGFYGAVTVSERGQIALPAQARRDLGISPGDKLLVLGDPEQGIALMSLEVLMRTLQGSSTLLEQIQRHAQGAGGPTAPPGTVADGGGAAADGGGADGGGAAGDRDAAEEVPGVDGDQV